MTGYRAPSSEGMSDESDQSRTVADADPPFSVTRGSLVKRLRVRFGTMEGRSVSATFAGKSRAAAIPTRPVPEPSSRT